VANLREAGDLDTSVAPTSDVRETDWGADFEATFLVKRSGADFLFVDLKNSEMRFAICGAFDERTLMNKEDSPIGVDIPGHLVNVSVNSPCVKTHAL
jgi:hypothetical protein